ncbi:MAG: RnfABCDGE type electron transport complex subunit D [Treponema sp.]|nr:RnfABCDGE type electron transport complex subunit D [Treponema sp.]
MQTISMQTKKQYFFSPFFSITPSTEKTSLTTLFLLILQVAMLFATKSYLSLFVIASCLIGSSLAAILVNFNSKVFNFSFLTCINQGIIAGMFLPETFPIISAFAITFVTFLLVYYMAGKSTFPWVNAVVVIVSIAWIVGMQSFPEMIANRENLQVKNPSLFFIEDGIFNILSFDPAITSSLNNAIFSSLNMSLPQGYISLLWDTGSVIPAFRFNLLTLASSAILFALDMSKMTVPTTFLLCYAVLVRFVSPLFTDGIFGQGDIILALFTGGTLFCAVFLIQTYGTLPITQAGKLSYGVLCAILAFFISGPGMSPIGMIFTFLCANLLSPSIQFFENRWTRKRLRYLISLHEQGAN